jgi:hypothetical protein
MKYQFNFLKKQILNLFLLKNNMSDSFAPDNFAFHTAPVFPTFFWSNILASMLCIGLSCSKWILETGHYISSIDGGSRKMVLLYCIVLKKKLSFRYLSFISIIKIHNSFFALLEKSI